MAKSTRHRAFDPDPDAPQRCCDAPGCNALAGYRAPRSRRDLTDYHWFCLQHVREYNASWDFYKGMTPGQIEAHLRADTSWQRPTWRLGQRGQVFDEDALLDPLDILGQGMRARARADRTEPPEPLRAPLQQLGLGWPVSLEDVKARYKDLARRHHPDANGGDQESEERLKLINVAYGEIRNHLAQAQEPARATG